METFYALPALCTGNLSATDEFPSQSLVTRSFDVFFFICASTNGWANNRYTGDLKRHRTHHDVTVMMASSCPTETKNVNCVYISSDIQCLPPSLWNTFYHRYACINYSCIWRATNVVPLLLCPWVKICHEILSYHAYDIYGTFVLVFTRNM